MTALAASGDSAKVTWETYEGANFFHVHQSATVSYAGGKLVLHNHVVDYSPEAVTGDVLSAAFEKKRGSLADPNVLNNAQWQQLTGEYAAYTFTNDGEPGACRLSGDKATCPIDGVASGPIAVTGAITLQKAPGTTYGWRVVQLQVSG